MKHYLVQIKWNKPYPKEAKVRTEASSMATAVGRGMREVKKVENLRGVKTLLINVSQI